MGSIDYNLYEPILKIIKSFFIKQIHKGKIKAPNIFEALVV
jgi:hypothetical protein